ncbi:F0F1 ATP synthase subunit epsilon [Acidothermaceae bacterium B102]|nr:F0F1 ATP synthase subunit epsilon [Acidothermaceae bacterium B102]
MAELQVDLVSVDRRVWSGEATMVIARTTEGEIGILPGHAPILGVLVDGSTVEVREASGETLLVAIDGGFLSVDESGVRILAESAVLGSEVDVAAARADLQANSGSHDDSESAVVARRAEARLRAAGQST